MDNSAHVFCGVNLLSYVFVNILTSFLDVYESLAHTKRG